MKVSLTAAGLTIGVVVCGGIIYYFYKNKNYELETEAGDDLHNSNTDQVIVDGPIRIKQMPSEGKQNEFDSPRANTPLSGDKKAIIDALANLKVQSLSPHDIEAINYAFLNFPDDGKVNVLKQIGQAAAFSSNMDVIRNGNLLANLQDNLHKAVVSRNFTSSPVTLNVVQALVNLACNEENQLHLQSSVADLVAIAENIEESEIGIASLKTLSNLSITNVCHNEIVLYIPYFYSLLDEEETDVLKQVIAILLNLSCDIRSLPELLGAEAPEADLVELSAGHSTITVANGLLTPWIRFMKNLFFAVKDTDWNGISSTNKADEDESMMAKLKEIRVQMKHKIFLLTSNKDCSGELGVQAREFYDCLQPAV